MVNIKREDKPLDWRWFIVAEDMMPSHLLEKCNIYSRKKEPLGYCTKYLMQVFRIKNIQNELEEGMKWVKSKEKIYLKTP